MAELAPAGGSYDVPRTDGSLEAAGGVSGGLGRKDRAWDESICAAKSKRHGSVGERRLVDGLYLLSAPQP
jgi:hypothetical protein